MPKYNDILLLFAQAHMRIMHIYNKDAKNSLCQEDDQQINQ